MRILVASYIGFDELPPAISFVKTLIDDGAKVDFVSYYKLQSYSSFFGKDLTCYSVLDCDRPRGDKKMTLIKRVSRSVYWRFFRNAHSSFLFSKKFNEIHSAHSYDQIWILHECTAKMLLPAVKKLRYSVVVYEIEQDVLNGSDKATVQAIKNAEKVVVPEFCRGEILRTYLELARRPFCVPNKPVLLEKASMADDVAAAIEVIRRIKDDGYTVLVYSGIITPERKLDLVIEATRKCESKCKLVVLGQRTSYLNDLQSRYDDSFSYLGFIDPPAHLGVIKHADVGVVIYVPTSASLNVLFCAPNKIWEYSGCGIPMLANDVPGLVYSVRTSGAGVCFDSDSIDDAVQSLQDIVDNRAEYALRAKEYFDSVDVRECILEAVRS